MIRILLLFLFGCMSIGIEANSFKPNGFLTRMMSKVSGEPTSSRVIPSRYTEIAQNVDYKNATSDIFQQKLVVYDDKYAPGGPIFFLISAQDDYYAYWIENSVIAEIVHKTGGAVYALEPRYHGESHPTPTASTSDLQSYFTLDHLMMDYVSLINYFKSYFESEYGPTKTILYGYGTGATLAAWIYNSHPNIADGVWASSAPMHPTAEFATYFSDVQATIKSISVTCLDSLEAAFIEIDALVKAESGSQISDLFNIGNPLNTLDSNDVNLFYYSLLTGIGSLVEYANVDVVTDFCEIFESENQENSLGALGNFFKEFFNGETLTYDDLVDHFKSDVWDSAAVLNGERQQLFQSCNYLSWFRTSSGASSFLNVNLPLEFYTKLCNDVFNIAADDIATGNELTAATYKIKADLPNMYFTNGALDPYRQVGITNEIVAQSSFDLIATVGKAYDFRQINEELDVQDVLEVKLKIKSLLESWISK